MRVEDSLVDFFLSVKIIFITFREFGLRGLVIRTSRALKKDTFVRGFGIIN